MRQDQRLASQPQQRSPAAAVTAPVAALPKIPLDDSPRAQRQAKQLLGIAGSANMAAQGQALQPFQRRGANVVQRLQVQGTDWSKVRHISASATGVGGVLFMSDGSDKRLVVKPGVPADEEMSAAHAHGAISNPGGMGGWKVKALTSRMAMAFDRSGIRAARDRVNQQNPLDARAAGLVGQVEAYTTLIQDATAPGAASMAESMAEQSPHGHLVLGADRIGSNKDKVKSVSPLKPLMNDNTKFACSLGRIAATDLLLGNFDRIVDAANLENMLLNKSKKVIYPIDNTGGTAVARLMTGGGGPVLSPGWAGHRLVVMFTAQQYANIADDVWTIGGGVAMVTLPDDLLTGFATLLGLQVDNVHPTERPEVQNKLQAHIQHIKAAFAAGIKAGRDELVAAGPPPLNSISLHARQQYAARLAAI